jgi:hypothetical protein
MNELWLWHDQQHQAIKNTTINLFEGEGGDDVNGNSNVAITADSKVCERRRYNELETIAAEEGE